MPDVLYPFPDLIFMESNNVSIISPILKLQNFHFNRLSNKPKVTNKITSIIYLCIL